MTKIVVAETAPTRDALLTIWLSHMDSDSYYDRLRHTGEREALAEELADLLIAEVAGDLRSVGCVWDATTGMVSYVRTGGAIPTAAEVTAIIHDEYLRMAAWRAQRLAIDLFA